MTRFSHSYKIYGCIGFSVPVLIFYKMHVLFSGDLSQVLPAWSPTDDEIMPVPCQGATCAILAEILKGMSSIRAMKFANGEFKATSCQLWRHPEITLGNEVSALTLLIYDYSESVVILQVSNPHQFLVTTLDDEFDVMLVKLFHQEARIRKLTSFHRKLG